MDQTARPTLTDSDQASGSPPNTARQLARGGVVLAIIAIAILVWWVISAQRAAARLQEATEAQSVITVATITPQPLSGNSVLVLPGNLQAHYEAPIYARTSGYLKRWYVDIGTPVKAGQLLGEIEAPEVDSQLRQAQADLATAEANQKIAAVTAERWRNLRASDSVSKQAADEKISQAASGDAQVRAARANVQRLRELSGFQKVTAPFDGIVTARNTDIGQLIVAGENTGPALFRVADMRKLRLYVRVPQTYAAMMQPGLTADVVFPDRPGKTFTARLDSTSSALDQATRTLLVQLIVDNRKNELFPGAYSEVHFKLPEDAQNQSFRVPANVLLFRADGTSVATVGVQSRVVLKAVQIGRDYGSDIEIVSGLKAGDKVIVEPPDSLTNGLSVRVAARQHRQAAKS